MTATAYSSLTHTFTRLHRLGHLGSIAGWDQAAMMPTGGNNARGAALAELQVLMHQTITAPQLKDQIAAASTEALDATETASLREMKREWETANRPNRWWKRKALRARSASTRGVRSAAPTTGRASWKT